VGRNPRAILSYQNNEQKKEKRKKKKKRRRKDQPKSNQTQIIPLSLLL
jgi:hypothetical protein